MTARAVRGPDGTALEWARLRSGGPRRVPAGGDTVPGTVRLPDPGTDLVWVLPQLPDSADARVLGDVGLEPVPVDQPNDTARMLAAVLRCCWSNPLEPPWPGEAAPGSTAIGLFRELTRGRDDVAQHRAAVAALRRLAGSGWLIWDDARRVVRLGPRVASWSPADLSVLRELWRSMPAPPDPEGGAA